MGRGGTRNWEQQDFQTSACSPSDLAGDERGVGGEAWAREAGALVPPFGFP